MFSKIKAAFLLALFFLCIFGVYHGMVSLITERTMNNIEVRRIDAHDYIISFTNGYGERQTYRGDKFEWFDMNRGQRDSSGYFSYEFEAIQRKSEWRYKDEKALGKVSR